MSSIDQSFMSMIPFYAQGNFDIPKSSKIDSNAPKYCIPFRIDDATTYEISYFQKSDLLSIVSFTRKLRQHPTMSQLADKDQIDDIQVREEDTINETFSYYSMMQHANHFESALDQYMAGNPHVQFIFMNIKTNIGNNIPSKNKNPTQSMSKNSDFLFKKKKKNKNKRSRRAKRHQQTKHMHPKVLPRKASQNGKYIIPRNRMQNGIIDRTAKTLTEEEYANMVKDIADIKTKLFENERASELSDFDSNGKLNLDAMINPMSTPTIDPIIYPTIEPTLQQLSKDITDQNIQFCTAEEHKKREEEKEYVLKSSEFEKRDKAQQKASKEKEKIIKELKEDKEESLNFVRRLRMINNDLMRK